MSLTPDVLSFQHSNEPKVNNETTSILEEELKSVQADAKETLSALLQFSEGVRLITRHMERATRTMDPAADDGECKSEEEDINNNNPSLSIETMVSETRLQGTVFGTDLLRLWDAAHHVRDYARSVAEESTLSSTELVDAQQTANRAVRKANKAETLALGLHRQNQDLRRQLDQVSAEKRRLIAEVKALRRQAATTRKMDMERLLQQHVAGAILLHEEQLKAVAAQEQQQQQQRKQTAAIIREAQEEEKKEEDEDMEVVVKAEDFDATAVAGVKKHVGSPKRSTTEQAGSVPTSPSRAAEADKENELFPCDVSGKDAASVGPEALSTPSTPSSAYSPVKLFPASPAERASAPPPPPFANESVQPSSARSVTSSTSNQSIPKPPPEQPRENVGSKVFNFLFHPEKIAQQRAQEMARQKQLEKQRPQPEPARASKPNPLLALDDLLMEEKDDASADMTAPTQAMTTPSSKSCASSSLIRARSIMPEENKLSTPKGKQSQKQQPPHNINNTIIPECVSFLDDTLSVQSNLPSPNQSIISDEDPPPQDVELYKDFKMFRSLAIPGDEEIDEYRQSRDAALKQ